MTCEAITQFALFGKDAEGNDVAEKVSSEHCSNLEYWTLTLICQCGHIKVRSVCREHGANVLDAICAQCGEVEDAHMCPIKSIDVIRTGYKQCEHCGLAIYDDHTKEEEPVWLDTEDESEFCSARGDINLLPHQPKEHM